MYKYSRLSNNPNYVHYDMKPESAIEDGELSEKNQNNFEINTNTLKDNKDTNNLSNENDINNEYNIDNENNIDNKYKSNISDNINNINNENNNILIIDDDENGNSNNENINNDNKGMSEKDY